MLVGGRQLGEFLYRVARVKRHAEVDVETPFGPIRMPITTRPGPSGGCLHDLEVYAAVNRCDGVARAFVKVFLAEVWRPFQRAGMPPDRWPDEPGIDIGELRSASAVDCIA